MNLKSFIQPSETLLIEWIRTHAVAWLDVHQLHGDILVICTQFLGELGEKRNLEKKESIIFVAFRELLLYVIRIKENEE